MKILSMVRAFRRGDGAEHRLYGLNLVELAKSIGVIVGGIGKERWKK